MDVTGQEFETFMEVLTRLNYISTEEGAAQVASLISDQADLSSDFKVSQQRDDTHVQCIYHIAGFKDRQYFRLYGSLYLIEAML